MIIYQNLKIISDFIYYLEFIQKCVQYHYNKLINNYNNVLINNITVYIKHRNKNELLSIFISS